MKVDEEIKTNSLCLGRYTTQAYTDALCAIAFIASRYKFCAKILSGMKTVLEIGCGDGFGGALVADKIERLICTDINEGLLSDNSVVFIQGVWR